MGEERQSPPLLVLGRNQKDQKLVLSRLVIQKRLLNRVSKGHSLPNVFRSPRLKKLKRRLSRSRTDRDHRERSPQPLKVAGAGFFRVSFFPLPKPQTIGGASLSRRERQVLPFLSRHLHIALSLHSRSRCRLLVCEHATYFIVCIHILEALMKSRWDHMIVMNPWSAQKKVVACSSSDSVECRFRSQITDLQSDPDLAHRSLVPSVISKYRYSSVSLEKSQVPLKQEE